MLSDCARAGPRSPSGLQLEVCEKNVLSEKRHSWLIRRPSPPKRQWGWVSALSCSLCLTTLPLKLCLVKPAKESVAQNLLAAPT